MRRHFQSLTKLALAFILIFSSLGLGGKIQPVAAATWTSFNPGFGVGSFGNEVAYGNGTWLLFSQSREFGKSTDSFGTAFQKSESVFPCTVLEAKHVGTQWLAACDTGMIYTLPDGQDPLIVGNWILRDSGKSGGLVGIATDGNRIVVVGNSGGTVLSSVDGHVWFDRSIVGVTEFKAVTYGEGKFIAVGRASDDSNVIYSSEDGETWGKVTTASPSNLLYGIAYGAGMFVACGLTGYLYVSDDGVTWKPKSAPDDTGNSSFVTVTYGSGQFYIGGTSETILISSNGLDFSKEIRGGSAKSVTSIAVANGKAIAVGNSGLLLAASNVPSLSSNASLANLLISPGSLTFNAATTSYTVEVPYGTALVSVTPTMQDPLATMTVSGASKSDGQVASVTLDSDGSTDIPIIVTAQDGTTKTYTITVNEAAPSANGYLSTLTVDGMLVSGFTKTTNSYSIEVPNATATIDVGWMLDEPSTQTLQSVKVDGVAQPLAPIAGLALTPGTARVIEIVVRAQGGSTNTYSLSVTRKKPNNAQLGNLLISPGSLTFNPSTTSYTVGVPYGTASVNVTPTMQDPLATMTVNGAIKSDGQVTSVTLDSDGSTDIPIIVTAQDGTTKTYTITVNEAAPSANGYLSALTVDGTLVSGFAKTTTGYSIEVPNATASIDVDWMFDDPSTQTLQSVKVDGVTQPLASIAGLALTPGTARVIEIVVKAQDGSTIAYSLTVTRKRPSSSGSGGSSGGGPSKNESTLPDGITQSIGNGIAVSIDIFGSDGKTPIQSGVSVDANGKFQFNSLKPGSYSLVLYLLADDGTKLAGQTAQLTVDGTNAAKVTIAEIDPYGTVADALTKNPLQGVKVSVYWADTERNRNKGHKPNTRVELPKVRGTANQNKNQQSTATDGQFGWLLPPEGDYYVIAEKDGYETYDGRGEIVRVGHSAVKVNIALQAKVLEQGVLKSFVSGYPNGTFRPNAGVTRAELASMLLKALGIQPRASAVEYSDVPASNWAAGAIAQLTEQGLMGGYPDGTFGPDRPITRAEFAVVLVRANEMTRGKSESSLRDIDGHWAKGAILLAEQAGLIQGNPDGTFNPDSKLTRAQAVVILNRMLGLTSQEKFEHRELSDVPADFWAYEDIMRAIADHEYQKLGNGLTVWK